MKAFDLNTNEAPVKWWAAQDARMRSIANSTHYNDAEKLRAERMKVVLEFMFHAKGIYIAYGKKGISIKVDGPSVKHKEMLKEIEAQWEQDGVTKKVSPQGIIYRLAV